MKYTMEELKQAVANSISIRQVLINLNLAPQGGNYNTIHRSINKHKIDTSHFKGQAHNKGKLNGPKRHISEYLIKNGPIITNHYLRKRLIHEGYFEHICVSCKLSEWLGEKINLELDHIDGDRINNEISNLRLLCPNCHSFTETYCVNKKTLNKYRLGDSNSNLRGLKPRASTDWAKTANCCLDCGKTITIVSKRCKSCSAKNNQSFKIQWPSINELQQMIKESSCLQVAKKLGVSDKSVMKHIKNYT